MGRFSNSLELAKQSWAVLKADKELAVIPAVSAIASTLLTLAFMGAVFFTLDPTTSSVTGERSYSVTPLTYGIGFIGTFFVAIVTAYFSGALVAGAYQRLTGHDPTLSSAFAMAWERFTPLTGWALLSATVGMIISTIQNRGGIFGAIAGRLAEFAWRVGSFLAVPVIIVEGTGPMESLSRSVALLKQTWGENLIAQAGFGILSFLIGLPVLVIGGLTIPLVPWLGIAIIVVWLVVSGVVLSALNGIYRTALYLYATGQQSPWFDQRVLQAAFRPKAAGRRGW